MVLVAATPDGIVLVDEDSATTVCARSDVRCLAGGPDRLYAGTQGGGVLRSDDDGRTWSDAGLAGQTVKALAVSGATVFAGTKPPRLFRSPDAGGTWTELPAFAAMRRPWWRQPAERPSLPYVSTVAALGDTIVAGIEAFKLLRSADGGVGWTRVGRGVAWDAHELVVSGGRLVLAAGFGASVSDDAGVSWVKVGDGLDRRYGFCAAPNFADAGSVFLAAAPLRAAHSANARACIYKLEGSRWHKLAGGLPDELASLPYALATSAADPERLYAGLGDGTIWRSHDGGATWERHPLRLNGLRRLTLI